MELAEQILVTVLGGQMTFASGQRDPTVGHDVVEVVHQVGLRHHREFRDICRPQSLDVDFRQPIAMPWRLLHRRAHQRTQTLVLHRRQPSCRPTDAGDVLRQELLEPQHLTTPKIGRLSPRRPHRHPT